MPVLSEFNMWPAAKLWMSEKERREIKSAPSSSSSWYTGVFNSASEGVEEKRDAPESASEATIVLSWVYTLFCRRDVIWYVMSQFVWACLTSTIF